MEEEDHRHVGRLHLPTLVYTASDKIGAGKAVMVTMAVTPLRSGPTDCLKGEVLSLSLGGENDGFVCLGPMLGARAAGASCDLARRNSSRGILHSFMFQCTLIAMQCRNSYRT